MYAVQFRVKEEKSVVKVTWNDEEDVDVCKDCCDDLGKNWEVGEWQDNEDCEYAHVGHVVLCKGREGEGKDEQSEEGGKREGRRREIGKEGGKKEGGRRKRRKKGNEGKRKGEKEGK